MSDQSKMSSQETLRALLSAISLPESADGRTLYVSQIGLMIDEYGREAVLANLSARQAKAAGLMTPATYGPHGSISSHNADLQLSLANRLRAKMAAIGGSILFNLTWKEWASPQKRLIYALRASARRTSDNDSTGWPTPMAGTPARNGNNEAGNTDSSRKTVELVPWNTPRATDGSNGGPNQAGGALSADAAKADPAKRRQVPTKKGDKLRWETSDEYWARQPEPNPEPNPAPWPTPDTNQRGGPQDPQKRKMGGHSVTLQDAAFGTLANGSSAPTEKRGQLNPAHSRWLMGYETAWDSCGAMAMQSLRKSRKRS